MNHDALLAQLNHVITIAPIQGPLRHKLGIAIPDKVKFHLTPDKGYTARADISVKIDGESTNMVALAFSPGDGTGDDRTYPVGSLTMHERIMFANKPWRVHPRKKSLPNGTPVMVEGMIPLFGTIPEQGTLIKFNSTLLQLGVGEDGQRVEALHRMRNPLGRGQYDEPSLLLTVGSNRAGERFGDPHTIYAPQQGNLIQVAAFITTNDINSRVFELLENHGKTPDKVDGVVI